MRACKPAGHRPHEVGGLRDLERGPHLVLGGVGLAELQVAGHRAGEQVRPLRHEADRAPQHVGIEVVNVDPADEHRALGAVEQPQDQVDERRLARAGAADDGRGLAGRGRERDAGEHRVLGAGIVEADVAELERTVGHDVATGIQHYSLFLARLTKE